MKVTLTEEAEHDLVAIGDYIALENPSGAVAFVLELKDKCLALAAFPRRFPVLSHRERDGIRRRIHGKYLIFYRVENDTVVVLHITHGAVDQDTLLSRH